MGYPDHMNRWTIFPASIVLMDVELFHSRSITLKLIQVKSGEAKSSAIGCPGLSIYLIRGHITNCCFFYA